MRGFPLTPQQESGRRRASSPVDALASDGSLEQLVDTALNGENTSRRPGRRAQSAVPDTVESAEAPQHGGRRFVATSRYAAAPTTASIAATELSPAPVARPLASAARRPRLGFVHRLAAVAAVSGLAVTGLALAAPGQETAGNIPEPQRVAQTSVADVTAPANDKLTVDRASLTSEYIEIKKEKPAPVKVVAAKVTTKKATKEAAPESTMPAAGGNATKIPAVRTLAQPVDSIRLTSRYGHRKNPTGPGYMIHNGLDYAVPMGTPVKASAAGTVVQAEWAGHSGYRVKIDHGNGLETSYNHNSVLKVSVGQKVKVGDVVSLSGSTGNSTGPHLHLEVIVNGQWVNPENWL